MAEKLNSCILYYDHNLKVIIINNFFYSGVFPYISFASTCTPESNNNFSTEILPFDAHLCNGVAPRLSTMSTSAPFDIKYLTI